MPKFKYIIFDWSGVIKDCLTDHLEVVNRMFTALGSPEITLAELQENWEQPYMRFYHKYLPDLTLEQEQIVYKKAVSESPPGKPYPGIARVLRAFHEAGIKMAVLSSDFSEIILPEIKSFGLEEVFIDVRTDVHDKSDGIHEIISKNNFNKDETIFIGDSNHEIEAGRNAGVSTGAVTWGFSTEARLSAVKPDYLIRDLVDLKAVII